MKIARILPLVAVTLPSALAQDLTVSRLGNNDDIRHWGNANSIAAYSFATTSCNIGTVAIPWNPNNKSAPIIGSNMFRIADGRIEHLGYSFVKYGLCSLDSNGNGCPGGCTDSTGGCDTALDPGCADVYSATLNDGRNGGGKWEVDSVRGLWPSGPPTGPTGNSTIRGRLQVLESDLQDPNAVYLIEGQYISGADHQAGNAVDNYGWRQVAVDAQLDLTTAGPTALGQPGIFAWQAFNDDVLLTTLSVDDEGGAGIHGWVFLGSKAIDLGNGEWRYEYAVQNGNSGRAVGRFGVRIPCDGDLTISNPTFHGVQHHSGSPYSSQAWTFGQLSDRVEWSTDDFASDPNAAAIRWGELCSFGFTANRGPAGAKAELALFVPGTPSELAGDVIAPGALFVDYCVANPNSTGAPAVISAVGSPAIEQAELSFAVDDLPLSSFGYMLMSQTQDFVANFGGSQGNLCLGSPLHRFSMNVLDSGTTGSVSFTLDFQHLPNGVQFQPGETWNFQYWYRDVDPQPTSNTTGGLSVTFCN